MGFEPTVPLPAHVLSKHAESATLAPLRFESVRGGHLTMGPCERQDDAVLVRGACDATIADVLRRFRQAPAFQRPADLLRKARCRRDDPANA